jgi:hypothetical protein
MKSNTKSLLTNNFKKTYNAREVDARLRILNEKRTSLMTTTPKKFLIVNIYIDSNSPGGGYKVNDKISIIVDGIPAGVNATVTEIGSSGIIKSLKWDKEVVYSANPENKRSDNSGLYEEYKDEIDHKIKTRLIDHPDVDDELISWTTTNITGTGTKAKVFIISRYAPGDTPGYGDLGRAVIDDPLVQESRLTGYVTDQLRNIEALHFIGYISDFAPIQYGTGHSVTKTESENEDGPYFKIPIGSKPYNEVELKDGDLWLKQYWTPTKPTSGNPPPSNTGVTINESGSPKENFPTYWKFQTDIKRWNGTEWLSTIPEQSKYFGQTYYTPDKLDLWSNLNVIKWDLREDESKISSPNNLIQNTGFYWFNGWRLFNFSVDEAQFVHKGLDEKITGWKIFEQHIDVPYTHTQLDKITDSKITEHTNHDGKDIGTGNHYATRAQVINSTLLKSGKEEGAKQRIDGKTTFSDNFSLGPGNVGPSDTDISEPQKYDPNYYYLGISKKDGTAVFSLGTGETSFVISAKTKTNFKNRVVIADTNETESTSPKTGALVVYGGVGITKDLYIAGSITMNSIRLNDVTNAVYLYDSSSTAPNYPYTIKTTQSGSLILPGGLDVAERVIIRGDNDSKGTVSGKEQSYQTGALIIEGGIGVAKSINTNGPVIIDVYANTTEDANVSGTPYTANRHTRIYNNYNTGLRVNGPGAIITIGGTVESQTGTSADQFNIIKMSNGVGTGFNDKGTTLANSQIYFPNDNTNPIVNNTKIPNLIFKVNNTGTIDTTGGSGYLDSGAASGYGAIEDNKTDHATPTTQKRTLTSQSTLVVPGIQVNNRGMITKMVTTEITIPGNAGTVGAGIDAENYSGFVRLGVQLPQTPNDYTGNAGTFNSYRVALHDHKHPAGLARYANQLKAYTNNDFTGTAGYIKAKYTSAGNTVRLYIGAGENITTETSNSVYVYYADQSGNADTIDGFHASQSPSANTVVVRNSSGYLMTGYINSNTGDESKQPPYLIYCNTVGVDGSDNYYRKTAPSSVKVGSAGYADGAGSVDGSVKVRAGAATDNSHGLYYAGDTFRGYIGFNASGNFNVWNSAGTSMFTCTTGGTVNAVAFNGTSSRTAKKNIKPFKRSALDVIKSIDVVSFKYKGDTEPQVGFIAEDTDPLLSGKEQKSMKMNTTIGILLKAIQELEDKVNALTKK